MEVANTPHMRKPHLYIINHPVFQRSCVLRCVNLTYYEPPNFPLQILSHSDRTVSPLYSTLCVWGGEQRRVNRWANISRPRRWPVWKPGHQHQICSDFNRERSQTARQTPAETARWDFWAACFLKTERLEMLSRGALSLAEKFQCHLKLGVLSN